MPINNRGLGGQPILPYVDYRGYAGDDFFMDLTFLDHTGVGITPVSLSYQVDDMTNAINMIPMTSVQPTGFQQTVTIPGSSMVMSHQWQGSQICQVFIQAQLGDGSHKSAIAVIELLSIQTPNNGS